MRDFCIYIVTFSFSAFIASCYVAYCKQKKKNNILIKSIWYFLIILPVAFLAGVRYGIGTDYHNYINMFDLYLQAGMEKYLYYFPNTSKGTIICMMLGKRFFGTSQGVLFIYSTLTMFFFVVSVLYYKERINVFLGIMMCYILLFPASMNIVRQMLSVSIVMFSLRYVEKEKKYTFVFWLIVAILIHTTAIVCCPILYIYSKKNKLNDVRRYIIYGVSIVFPILMIVLFAIGPSLPYVSYLFENYTMSFNTEFVVDLIIRLIIYIPLLKYIKKDVRRDKRNIIYYYMALMDFEFILASFIFSWGYRLSYYVVFAQIILIGNRITICSSQKSKRVRIVKYAVFYLVMFAVLFCFWERDGIVPYDTIFNHGINIWR